MALGLRQKGGAGRGKWMNERGKWLGRQKMG